MRQTTVLPDVVALRNEQVAPELTLEKARELLDWLEANDFGEFETEIEESGQCRVGWSVKREALKLKLNANFKLREAGDFRVLDFLSADFSPPVLADRL